MSASTASAAASRTLETITSFTPGAAAASDFSGSPPGGPAAPSTTIFFGGRQSGRSRTGAGASRNPRSAMSFRIDSASSARAVVTGQRAQAISASRNRCIVYSGRGRCRRQFSGGKVLEQRRSDLEPRFLFFQAARNPQLHGSFQAVLPRALLDHADDLGRIDFITLLEEQVATLRSEIEAAHAEPARGE